MVYVPIPLYLIKDKYGARKIHYTADIVMALCWGLACGFSSFLPYWYVVWITIVVVQRAIRDVAHCREKYGEEWKEYERLCPYMFIPVHNLITPSNDSTYSRSMKKLAECHVFRYKSAKI
jgi:hypothetical protein